MKVAHRLAVLFLMMGFLTTGLVANQSPVAEPPVEVTEPGEYLYIYNDLTYANHNASREFLKRKVILNGVVFDTLTFSFNGPPGDKNGTMVILEPVGSHGVTVRVPGKFKSTVLKLCKGQGIRFNAVVNDLQGNDLSFTASSIELVGPVIEKAPPQKDPIKITADQLWQEYKKDIPAAHEAWFRKKVEITGFCLGRDENLVKMIDPILGITCNTPKSIQKTVDMIKAGQCVTVTGTVDYFTGGTLMIAAKAITLSDAMLPSLSAGDIFQEFENDAQKARSTYVDKYFSIHGNLVSVLIQQGGLQRLILTLRTGEDNNVWCYLPSSTDDNIKNLVEDSEMSVVGRIKEYKTIEGRKRLVVEAIHYAASPQ